MSFSEKVHARLLALESQVQALDQRLKALEPVRVPAVLAEYGVLHDGTTLQNIPVKRGPGRPRKEANGV